MKLSALKLLATMAITTTACVSFAQPAGDANAPATSPSSSSGVAGEGAMTETRSPTSAPVDTGRSCIGLADRQSERACREGYPLENAPSSGPSRDRNVDDQAG